MGCDARGESGMAGGIFGGVFGGLRRGVSWYRDGEAMMTDDRMAPDGAMWVCGACGKTSDDRYGTDGEHSHGWDESCVLNAVLCYRPTYFKIGGRVTTALPLSPKRDGGT